MAEATLVNPETSSATMPIYQGSENKMDIFNEGRYAVKIQLRTGEQQFDGSSTLAFQVDPNDSSQERVINLEDARAVQTMKPAEAETVLLVQNRNGRLIYRIAGSEQDATEKALAGRLFQISLNGKVGIEIVDFDPNENSILIRKVKPQASPLPPITPGKTPDLRSPSPTAKEGWQFRLPRRLVNVGLGLGALATVTGNIPRDTFPNALDRPSPVIPPISDEQRPPDETSSPQSPLPASEIKKPKEVGLEEDNRDETLKCPGLTEYIIKPGDSLTAALVKVNGMGRYFKDGNLDVGLLYQDLACLLVQPENQAVLEKSDPVAAKLIKNIMDQSLDGVLGKRTADMLYEGLRKINTENGPRFPGAHEQLAIIQPREKILVPTYPVKEVIY